MAKTLSSSASNVTPLGTPGTLTAVTVVAGVPTAGSGTVSTLDNIFNATNGPADITAANTAAVASQKGVVVSISPNGQTGLGRAADTASNPVVACLQDRVALADDSAFTAATTNVGVVGFFADETATDSVDEGDAGAARMTLDRKQIVTNQPHTSGGLDVFVSLDMDESEEDVKTSPGCLYKLRITNRTASPRYVKLYNATAATAVVGTTAPLDVIPVPGNATDYTVLTESFGGQGLTFSTALSIAATTGFANSDTGAPGLNDLIVSAYYK